ERSWWGSFVLGSAGRDRPVRGAARGRPAAVYSCGPHSVRVVHAGPRRRPDLEAGEWDRPPAHLAAAVGPLLEALFRGVEVRKVRLGTGQQRLGAGAVYRGGLPLGVVL